MRRSVNPGGNSLKNWFIILFALAAVLMLASCNTAGELPQGPVTPIVPPPGVVATRSAQPTAAVMQPAETAPAPTIPTVSAPVPVTFPQQPPVAQLGQSIFTTNCVPCHGSKGQGDGPQSQQIVAAMGGKLPNLADPAYARSAKPSDWFTVISNGRIQKGMPPFTSLDTDDRWDVVAYLYTLSISPEQLDKGKTVYADKCATCHGATGKPAAADTPDLSDIARMAGKSQTDFDAIIAAGRGAMPGFSALSQAERQAASDYVRSLAISLSKTAAPTGTASIVGALVNGTAGASVPGNVPVTLYALTPDGSALMYTRTVGTDAGGRFAFDKLDAATPIMYGLQVSYLKGTYTSDAVSFAHGGLTLTVPITVYETTTDGSQLAVEQMHMFFDNSGPGMLNIGQLFIMSNSGDRAYLGADGTSVRFPLPPNATNVNFMDGELGGRYQAVEGGFADTEAVAPGLGTTQVFVLYDLPYDGKKLDVNLKMPYSVKSINVLVPESQAKLASSQLTQSGVRQTQTGNMVNYIGGNIAAGQSLVLQLTGAVAALASQPSASNVAASPVLIVASALLLVAVAIVAFVWLRQRRQAQWIEEEVEDEGVEARQDELLTAIATLDDDYEAGRIQEADYRRRRAELKAELKELMS
jgi:cbb3-type cytochrome c oxidase subunit III